ncbi:MAG: tRNA uridine-5-carboxymethylaminomethyl(34) synthesis GTPase MnmE [Clostridiales Family XIII bacterium]|jgi:tRNA modification GTPase|nr:tRNA uridine-5-carboxymethylaminomethyl(34) synthesis GTPase MnmE [Clostridiales Family XIII bacterium]
MAESEFDTIAAISTAPGEGGIGIVRMSGARAGEILARVFVRPLTAVHNETFPDRAMVYGHVVDPGSGEVVDEVLAVLMRGPGSYTGEDVCEIQCHGGTVPLRRILEICYREGAAPAAPGEFTKRAFLNGRIDLVQAGAVADLIRAGTERSYRAARAQAEGRLSARIREARELLLSALAEAVARMDYPEAFEDEGKSLSFSGLSRESRKIVDELLASVEEGRLVRDGLRVCIVGAPNVGKSSLFNALARENAAIVTAVPGTTRDALEIWLNVRGMPVMLVDTAGIREAAGEIEALGIEKSRERMAAADVLLFVLDGSRPITDEDRAVAADLDAGKRTFLVLNKQDLPQAVSPEEARALAPHAGAVISLSAAGADSGRQDAAPTTTTVGDGLARPATPDDAAGVRALEEALVRVAGEGAPAAGGGALVTRAWQAELLARAAAELDEAEEIFAHGDAPEFAEVNLRAAYEALGELIGETYTDDILDRVFSDFCVGK